MSKLQTCPICDCEPKYPQADLTTGWTFCSDCYRDVRADYKARRENADFANWLRAVADMREKHAGKCLAADNGLKPIDHGH